MYTGKYAADQPAQATPVQAYDELIRELQVRERCFPKWVREQRISPSDARDRLERIKKACELLFEIPEVKENSCKKELDTDSDQVPF